MGVSRETAALAALLAAGTTAALAAYFYLLRSNKAVSQLEVQETEYTQSGNRRFLAYIPS
jgi:hypothetical protein